MRDTWDGSSDIEGTGGAMKLDNEHPIDDADVHTMNLHKLKVYMRSVSLLLSEDRIKAALREGHTELLESSRAKIKHNI